MRVEVKLLKLGYSPGRLSHTADATPAAATVACETNCPARAPGPGPSAIASDIPAQGESSLLTTYLLPREEPL